MSWYASKKNVYEWALAQDGLRHWMAKADYPELWRVIEKQRLGRVGVGLLKILWERRLRVDSSEMTNAVTKQQLSDALRCTAAHIADAVNRINDLVVKGAREGTFARQFGLVWRNQFGVGIHPGFSDLGAARAMSEKQIAGTTKRWRQNVEIVNEAEQEQTIARDEIEKFNRLSPEERRRLLSLVGEAGVRA